MDCRRIAALAGLMMTMAGCAGTGGSVPVTDAGRAVSNEELRVGAGRTPQQQPSPAQSRPADGGVVVMVPDEAGGSRAIESYPLDSQPPLREGNAPQVPAGAPSQPQSGGLQADEQLDGPVLALLTVAREQEGRGDLGSASASLERAMRIAPREPQVLYRLAQVRLSQGDAAQAEQLAQRGLSYAAGRPTLQAGLWELIAQARERQGNAAGAAEARQRARVTS
ncbi:Tetratricopeptide repeat-containing protein [Halopseudomonas xinjiangensis]|uniref:Tetratricopeptide repeat-containing protein n=1 Tax=Halopseudomonas xinjiangensis TaxID=487184 RepID=A0A1H1W3K8_9GAMM|nr:tetratricopeptide repeat protein [Halopseudomonas xinjiangensis]SDS91664.1 Tetratricopeptide repeat-containing protein [Halopseudomonas xinjiangensis]